MVLAVLAGFLFAGALTPLLGAADGSLDDGADLPHHVEVPFARMRALLVEDIGDFRSFRPSSLVVLAAWRQWGRAKM